MPIPSYGDVSQEGNGQRLVSPESKSMSGEDGHDPSLLLVLIQGMRLCVVFGDL